MNLESKTAEFLGMPLEKLKDKNNKALNNIFKTTLRIGESLVKEFLQGDIKLTKQSDDFLAIADGDREMFFLGSLARLKVECEKLAHV